MTIAGGRDYQGPKVVDLRGRPFGAHPPTEGLKGGGGGGTFDDMEARVASLEADMRNVRENVGLIRTDVREAAANINAIKLDLGSLTSNVGNLPTKEWGVNAVIKLAAFIVALSIIATAATIFVPKLLQTAPAPPPATSQK
jgi:hypothetical protein